MLNVDGLMFGLEINIIELLCFFITKNVLICLNVIFAVFLCHVNPKLDCNLLVFNNQLLVEHWNLLKNQHQYMCAANH